MRLSQLQANPCYNLIVKYEATKKPSQLRGGFLVVEKNGSFLSATLEIQRKSFYNEGNVKLLRR